MFNNLHIKTIHLVLSIKTKLDASSTGSASFSFHRQIQNFVAVQKWNHHGSQHEHSLFLNEFRMVELVLTWNQNYGIADIGTK